MGAEAAALGRMIGVGVGPGDPELLTLKAVAALASADVVAFFHKAGRPSRARASAAPHLREGVTELGFGYPVTTEAPVGTARYDRPIAAFYDAAAAQVAAAVGAGQTVAVLSEGDPFFYGSYMHLHMRLAPSLSTEVIPGVPAMAAGWCAAGTPLVQGDDVLEVLPGTLPEARLAERLRAADAAVIMKVGRNLARVRGALAAAGRLDRAIYVERAAMPGGWSGRLADKTDDAAPYFSMVFVPGWADRP